LKAHGHFENPKAKTPPPKKKRGHDQNTQTANTGMAVPLTLHPNCLAVALACYKGILANQVPHSLHLTAKNAPFRNGQSAI